MGLSSSKQDDFTDIKTANNENNENYDKCDDIDSFNKRFCIKDQLIMLEKYVKLDVKNVDKKREFLEHIYEDKNRFINLNEFESKYTKYYNYLSLLGKTAFDICKVELSIRYTYELTNNHKD